MSRSRRKQKRGSKKRRNKRLGKFLLISAMVGLVGLAVLGFIGYLVLRSYLHSDKFRMLVSDETSKALDAQGEFEEFDWQGKSMYTRSFAAQGTEAAFFSRLKAHEIRARVGLGGVGRGVWEIPSVQINKFDFVISDDRLGPDSDSSAVDTPVGDGDVEEASSSGGGGFFSGLIPSEVEIQEVDLQEVNFNVLTEGRLIEARGIKAKMAPTSAMSGFSVGGRGGTLRATGFPDFTIDDFTLRTGQDRLYLDHAAMRYHKSGKVQVSGDASLGGETPDMLFNGVLSGLDLADVLPADWVKKFKGIVNGGFRVATRADGQVVTSGTLNLRSGSLEAMPVLKRIDTFAGTTRFRKLNFTNVEVEFEQVGGELDMGEILFESAGLGCLKGKMRRNEDGLRDGIFMLGISPDTIKYIPIGRKQVVEQVFNMDRRSAFTEVFPNAESDDIALPPDGYRWLVARLDPESADPYTADLRRQFIEAGGLAIWAELQGMSERAVQAAGEIAKVAGDQGVDLISMLAEEGLGVDTLILSEDMIEKMGESLKIEDLFNEGTAIPKSIIDSGFDVINDLNPLAPKRERLPIEP